MSGEFYYPFKTHNDPVSNEHNRTALEEFLNNSQFYDLVLGDNSDVDLTPPANQYDYLEMGAGTGGLEALTDKGLWTLTKDPGSTPAIALLHNDDYDYVWNSSPWGLDWQGAVHKIDIDLGQGREVQKITWGQNDATNYPDQIAIYYSSNGTDWTLHVSEVGLAYDDPENGIFTFAPITARYWRIQENNSVGSGATSWSINEIDVFAQSEVSTGVWVPKDPDLRFHRIDGSNTPLADIPFATHKITGLGDPTAAQDAATKAYVDSETDDIDTAIGALELNDLTDVNIAAGGYVSNYTKTFSAVGYDGIFDALGHLHNTTTWLHPETSRALVTTSQVDDIDGTRTSDKAINQIRVAPTDESHTQDTASSWWKVDFGASAAFAPNYIALWDRTGSGSGQNEPKYFEIQGSHDDSAWDTLYDSSTGPENGGTWSAAISNTTKYRYLRLIQDSGGNKDGNDYLIIGNIELWGDYGYDGIAGGKADGDVTEYDSGGSQWVPVPHAAQTTKGDLTVYDTALTRLAVGTDTHVLTADSAEATGVKWAAPAAGGQNTTKGDLEGFSTVAARIPVGTDTHVLTADSAEALGVKWAAAAGGYTDPLTTKGDLVAYGSSSDRLPVGTDTHVLTADSAEAAGVKWAASAAGFADPLTTKGDLIVFGSATDRFAVGTDTHVLTADSAEAAGVKWAAVAAGVDVLTTKGDLHTYDTDDQRLAIGTNDYVLTADSAEATGMKWAAAAGGGGGGRPSNYLDAIYENDLAGSLSDDFDAGSLDAMWTLLYQSTATTAGDGWVVLENSQTGTGTNGNRGGNGIYAAVPSAQDFTIACKTQIGYSDAVLTSGRHDNRIGMFIADSSGKAHCANMELSVPRAAEYIGVSTYSRTGAWSAYDGTVKAVPLNHSPSESVYYKIFYDYSASTAYFYFSMGGPWQLVHSLNVGSSIDDMGLFLWSNGSGGRRDDRLAVDWFWCDAA